MSEWIPVSERLPDVYDVYLVTTSEACVGITEFDPGSKEFDFENGDMEPVIAWMPLPKPFREEGAI